MFTVFYLLLTALFITEGLGLPYGHNFAFLVTTILALFIIYSFFVRKLKFPIQLICIYALFLIFTLVSALYSTDIIISLQGLIFYINCFMVLLFSYNYHVEIRRLFIPFIFTLGIIFCLYSLVLNLSLINLASIFYPNNGYQLVYSYTLSHNHLGDFLLLPLIICFYILLADKRTLNNPPRLDSLAEAGTNVNTNRHQLTPLSVVSGQWSVVSCWLLIAFFLLYFIFSYSRSAYIDLAVIGLFIVSATGNRLKNVKIKLAILLISVFLIFVTIAVSSNSSHLNSLDSIRNGLKSYAPFREKVLLGARIEYAYEGAKSILKNPLFGIGPGNFYLASIKYTNFPGLWTESAHSIFIDIFVENGVIAGILFALFIYKILKTQKRELYFYLALGLLLNFQTDYTYRIYSILILYFILLGMHLAKDAIER